MSTFQLPTLPYAPNALEPVISSKTIEFHHGKHHQAYVNNLNKLIEGTPYEGQTLEAIILQSDGGLFNNAAQVWNHTFYWESLCAPNNRLPNGLLGEGIDRSFGSFEAFQEAFSTAAATQFGSGWVWLVKNGLYVEIIKTSNADTPLREGKIALLTIDVWEHAYYLDYQNKRPDYIKAFWSLVNWEKVEERFNKG